MLETGQALPTDFYWQEGMNEWGVVSDKWQKAPPPTPPARPSLAITKKTSRKKQRQPLIHALLAATVLLGIAAFLWFTKPQPAKEQKFSTFSTRWGEYNSTPTPAPEGHLRVVSWNLEWYPGGSMNATPAEAAKHEQTAKADLARINPDIFLAQEIRTWFDFERLASSIPGLHTAVVSAFRLGAQPAQQQVAIASRLPVNCAWAESWKPASPSPPRGFSAAVLEVPDSTRLLLAYSLHLKSNMAKRPGDDQDNFRKREESVRQLLIHVRDMESLFQGRISGIIVGGDFNTNDDGQFADQTISMMVDAGFHNSWSGIPANARQTWRGSRQHKPTTFDFIFTKGISPLPARLIQSGVSDHLPIELSVPLAELRD